MRTALHYSKPRLHMPPPDLLALGSYFLLIPLILRFALEWSHPYGYLSDLAIGTLLMVLLWQRPWWLSLPLMLLWYAATLGTAELVSAVSRMPEVGDLRYLTDTQLIDNSTQGAGLSHPLLAISMAGNLIIYQILNWRRRMQLLHSTPRSWLLAALALLATHTLFQYYLPTEIEQWQQFNLPHKLLTESATDGQLWLQERWDGEQTDTLPDITGLTQLDLDGTPLLDHPGTARNVLIITLEGVPGAYLMQNHETTSNTPSGQAAMPRLAQWAQRGMLTTDYVLHSHQTIRGLYAMLCGDYSKLDTGTPKGVELLSHPERSQQCLPAQLHQHGFSTHYLQGAGLRFMAKDQIMPRMGFDQTLGLEWFTNKPYLDFPWGMDDKAYFEGALTYVQKLRQQKKPWMLTLLTVGTHQPYSAPEDYLEHFPNAKQAAIAYLDDAVADFLTALEHQGALKDTLVVVTPDESHGMADVRLASAWGFNLILAPEQNELPALKNGVYGHIDLTASILDYLDLPVPLNLTGRSLLRDYVSGREIMSYTNGMLRYHDGKNTFTECDFWQVCRRYASPGFIAASARYLGRSTGQPARLISQRATQLDHSLQDGDSGYLYQFANLSPIALTSTIGDDWADNLIGAQYLELPKNTRTTVSLTIEALRIDSNGATLQLKTKEYDQAVDLAIPELPLLTRKHPIKLHFTFDNIEARKAFSFHLLGQGNGTIRIRDFQVASTPITSELLIQPLGAIVH